MGGWITTAIFIAILMVDGPFTERYGVDTQYGADMGRYQADSGLVKGEVGWREEGEGRGGGGRLGEGGERGGEGGGTIAVITIYYYYTIVDL